MKLNYRDKVILGVLIAIILLIAGFVGLVKPKKVAIETDKKTLQDKQDERDDIQKKIDQIVPLTNEINDTYTATNKLAGDFVDYDSIYDTTYLDQFLREYADECELKVSTLNVSALAEGALNYYYFTPVVVGEKMFTASDLNGSLTEAFNQDKAESDALSERNVETVLTAKYAVTVEGTRENIWNYMKAIEEQDEAIIIDSVAISDYTFGETTDADGNVRESEDGTSKVSFVVSLYSVYDMAKPNTDAD
ncbi:MAG: hypothetical protein IJ874_00090 [Ruminococcus sp.]|nr:hypothetical protein [Ruminococcus sp.]